MARNGSGVYSLPANTAAVSGDAISSTKFNTLVQDLESDANVDRPVAAGGTGASTATGARTNLGLVIGTDVQAYDAGLLSIAGLTTLADRMIYTTDSDVYAVTPLTSFARTLLDDADAATALTTLGGQTLNANLTAFAGLSLVADRLPYADGTGTLSLATFTSFGRSLVDDANQAAGQATLGYTAADVLSKLLTVDGAGSSLDADTVDGVQANAFGQLGSSQTWTNANAFSLADPIRLSAAAGTQRRIIWQTAGTARWFLGADNTSESGSNAGTDFVLLARTDAGSAIGTALSVVRSTMAATFGGALASTTIHSRVLASSETSGTLTAASANTTIPATGDITINNSVFAAGVIILIYAGASARAITQGSGVTMRLDGTATTGSRTLAARGVAILYFVSASEVVVAGGAVT